MRIVSLSDIHLGSPRIDPEVIPFNFKKIVYPLVKECDLLVIAGDFFDGLLDMGNRTSFHAITIIKELCELAEKHMFDIRVLQGTFTHDRKQTQFFNLFKSPRIKFIDKIFIEHLEHLHISIAYKPDDLPFKDASSRLKQAIKDAGLTKVDFLVNHGYFNYMLPKGMPHIPNNTLDEKTISSLVKGAVLNGHVHTKSICGNILNHGSFDRLRHGEEEDKGLFVLDYVDGVLTHKFIKNPYATLFITLDFSGIEDDIEKCTNKVLTGTFKKQMENDVSTSDTRYIRVIAKDPAIRKTMAELINTTYPHVLVSAEKGRHVEQDSEWVPTKLSELPRITPDNLPELIHKLSIERNKELEYEYIRRSLDSG